MWDRKELKARGKAAFQGNYWKCVLVAFLMMALVFGGLGTAGREGGRINLNLNQGNQSAPAVTAPDNFEHISGSGGEQSIDQLPPEIQQAISHAESGGDTDPAIMAIVLAVAGGIIGIMILLGSLVKILVMNPLEVGCKGFFLHNSTAPASLSEIGYGFQDWGRNVWTMFLKDLFVCLWGLLFLIPGIVKHYSYQLVPYLMAEDPTLRGTDAITLSRKLMNGHKWRAFVLDLSFLGWMLLSGLTANLLGIFYVNPYIYATDAELYRAIREGQAEIT